MESQVHKNWYCAKEPVIAPALGKVWDSVLPVCLPCSAVSLFERSNGNLDHLAG